MNLNARNILNEKFENDSKLWKDLKSGDQKALSEVYRKYIKRLYKYGMTITQNPEVVKDAIQDLFIEIWAKRDRLGMTDNILYYLLKSLRRELVRRSGEKLKQTHKQQLFLQTTLSNTFQTSIESQIILSESEKKTKEALKKAINELPERQREVLFLLYYEKLSFKEISSIMSIDLKTVYKLNWRGIGKLRSVLSKALITALFLLNSEMLNA